MTCNLMMQHSVGYSFDICRHAILQTLLYTETNNLSLAWVERLLRSSHTQEFKIILSLFTFVQFLKKYTWIMLFLFNFNDYIETKRDSPQNSFFV